MRRKLILSALLIVAFLAITVKYKNNNANAYNDMYIANDTVEHDSEFFVNEDEAIEMYTAFIDSLNKSRGINNQYTVDDVVSKDFPDYYAGAYLNKNGNMVVNIQNDYYDNKAYWVEDFTARVKSDNYLYRPADYSYSEIIDGMNDIVFGKLYTELTKHGLKISRAQINDYKNCVEILTDSSNYERVAEILEDNELYEVRIEEAKFKECTGVYPGEDLVSGTKTFSAAVRAKMEVGSTTSYGFLTCGHAYSSYGQVKLSASNNNTLVGIFGGSSTYQYSGNTDAAFVFRISGIDLFDTLYLGSIRIKPQVASLIYGSTVFMRGGATGLTSGTVMSSSSTSEGDGIPTLHDVVITTYNSTNGDSGGVVFKSPNIFNEAKFVGIHSRGAGGYGCYTKAQHALDNLGVSLY